MPGGGGGRLLQSCCPSFPWVPASVETEPASFLSFQSHLGLCMDTEEFALCTPYLNIPCHRGKWLQSPIPMRWLPAGCLSRFARPSPPPAAFLLRSAAPVLLVGASPARASCCEPHVGLRGGHILQRVAALSLPGSPSPLTPGACGVKRLASRARWHHRAGQPGCGLTLHRDAVPQFPLLQKSSCACSSSCRDAHTSLFAAGCAAGMCRGRTGPRSRLRPRELPLLLHSCSRCARGGAKALPHARPGSTRGRSPPCSQGLHVAACTSPGKCPAGQVPPAAPRSQSRGQVPRPGAGASPGGCRRGSAASTTPPAPSLSPGCARWQRGDRRTWL